MSDSFSVYHQESSTVHTAIGICHTGYADCLLAAVSITCPKHAQIYSKNKFWEISVSRWFYCKKLQLFRTTYTKFVYIKFIRREKRNSNMVLIFLWRMFPKGRSAGVYRALCGGTMFLRHVEINSLYSMFYQPSRSSFDLCETTKKPQALFYIFWIAHFDIPM